MKRETLMKQLIIEDPRELAARYVAAIRRQMCWSDQHVGNTNCDRDEYWKLRANSETIERIGLYLHGPHFAYAVRSFPEWNTYGEHDAEGYNLFSQIKAGYSKEV